MRNFARATKGVTRAVLAVAGLTLGVTLLVAPATALATPGAPAPDVATQTKGDDCRPGNHVAVPTGINTGDKDCKPKPPDCKDKPGDKPCDPKPCDYKPGDGKPDKPDCKPAPCPKPRLTSSAVLGLDALTKSDRGDRTRCYEPVKVEFECICRGVSEKNPHTLTVKVEVKEGALAKVDKALVTDGKNYALLTKKYDTKNGAVFEGKVTFAPTQMYVLATKGARICAIDVKCVPCPIVVPKPVLKPEFGDTCEGVLATLTKKGKGPKRATLYSQVGDNKPTEVKKVTLWKDGETTSVIVPGVAGQKLKVWWEADGLKRHVHKWTPKICTTPTPTPTPTPTTPAGNGGGVPPVDNEPTLPVTGASVPGVLGLGAAVLLGGVVLMIAARRRRRVVPSGIAA